MRNRLILLFVLLAYAIPSALAESLSCNNVMLIDYVGPNDRPVFPVIIGDSKQNVEQCRNQLQDPISVFAGTAVVSTSVFTSLEKIAKSHGIKKPIHPHPFNGETLTVTVYAGDENSRIVFRKKNCLALLNRLSIEGNDRLLSETLKEMRESLP